MAKKFSSLIFVVIFLSFFSTSCQAQTVISGEHIQSYNSQIKINKDGTINVKETIVYDFGSLAKHGIYRDIPHIKTNIDRKKYILSFSSFSVVDENSNQYQFTKTDENETIRLKIGSPTTTITGVRTYIISYQVAGALTYFSDHDELNWNITGNDWRVPILLSTSGVLLPAGIGQNDIKNDIKTVCYTGSFQSREQDCTWQIIDNKVTIKSNNIIYSNQGLTTVVSFPKGMVAVLEPKEYISFWNTFLGKLVILAFILLGLIWYIVLPVLIPLRWYLAGRDPKPTIGMTTAWYNPPKNKDGRFLTPAETWTLIDEHVEIKDICALIVDLARRGYLKIIEKKGKVFGLGKSFSLEKTKEADNKLTNYEQEFFTGIFSGQATFELKNNKMFDIVETAKKNLYDQVVTDGFFPKNPNKVRNSYYILAVLALLTGNIHLAIITYIFARVMPRKTLLGAEQSAVAKSLKNFLSSQERQLEFQAKNQLFFEKLLPYAVAFGVEKVWAERFKDINLTSPDWYQGYSGSQFNSILLVSSLNSSFSRISSSAATLTRSSSGFSSGFG